MYNIQTAFIGPVQTVDYYLNYTKLSYFSLLEVADLPLGKGAKNGSARVLHSFPWAGFEPAVDNPANSL
jgi:hypothetical protein